MDAHIGSICGIIAVVISMVIGGYQIRQGTNTRDQEERRQHDAEIEAARKEAAELAAAAAAAKYDPQLALLRDQLQRAEQRYDDEFHRRNR